MSIQDIADRIATEHKMPKAEAKRVVETVLKAIGEGVKSGEMSLSGFGKFKVQDKPARQGRNPRTGESIQIAASRKLTFQPAKALRDTLG